MVDGIGLQNFSAVPSFRDVRSMIARLLERDLYPEPEPEPEPWPTFRVTATLSEVRDIQQSNQVASLDNSLTSFKTISTSSSKDEAHMETEYSSAGYTYMTISTCSIADEEHMESEYSSEGSSSSRSLTSFKATTTRSSTNEEHMETGYSSEGSTSLTSFKAISTGSMSDEAHMAIEYVAQSLFAGQSSSKDNGQIQASGLKRKRSCSDMPHTQPVAAVAHTTQDATQVQDAEMATIKVSYNENMIKFLLPYSASMADLIENVTTRLDVLKNKPFQIKYEDEDEDDVWILITCDKDLEYCMASSVAQKAIRMSVVPIPNL